MPDGLNRYGYDELDFVEQNTSRYVHDKSQLNMFEVALIFANIVCTQPLVLPMLLNCRLVHYEPTTELLCKVLLDYMVQCIE
jgi:hypothetical protein